MAECSYARCLQERRLIKRELMKWSKDMLHIVGLERVAEELMERMKWKNYQETLTRTHSNTDQVTASAEQQHTTERQNDRARDHQNVPQTLNSNKTQQALTAEALHADPEVKGHRQPADEGSEGKQLHKRADYNDAFAVEIANNATTTTSHIHSQATSNSNNSISNGNINNCNSNNTATIVNAKASLQIATNITKTSSNGVNESSARRNAYSVPPAQPQPPPESEPVDWKPNEKCHFCVDGKLLTVNAKGELVAESGLAVAESDQGPRLDTDSDSNESSNLASSAAVGGSLLANNNNINININSNNNNNRVNLNKLLTSRLTELPANMTSMDSMAAQLAVMQTFSDYPNFNWLQLVQQQQQQQQQQRTAQPSSAATPTTSDTSVAAVSPSLKGSPSPSDATGEQPLDLSSKPSPNSSISGDLNTVRSNTTRVTPTPTPTARRTYTDDDLNNAMQDIISGRLGARKAADQYNVPRSTLRNKVNRLAMGVKRANVHMPPELLHELEMDKELSGDDGGDDSNVSTPQPENQPALEELASRIATSSTLRQLCANNGNYAATRADSDTSASANLSPKLNAARTDGGKRETATPTSTAPPQSQPQASPQLQLPPMLIDSGMLIQLVLAAGNLNALQAPRLDQPVTLRDILLHLKDALEGRAAAAVGDGALNNGKPSIFDQPLLLQKLQQQPTPPYSHRLPKSETPETTSSLDPNETADDPSAILKIPSYKPAAGTSGAARASCSPSLLCNNNANSMPNRNGDSPNSAPSPRIANSMLAAAVAAVGGSGASAAANRQPNDMPVISPPLLHRHNRDSQSPQSFSFRDVIANSIHRTMNEQVNQDAHAAATASMFGLGLDVERTNSSGGASDYKKPSISVVKNIGGTDTSRFGAAPNLLATAASGAAAHHHHQPHAHLQHTQHAHHSHHHHSTHHLSRQEAAALAAGKGTRPKRGKYRNYDRDSLIEAVRAVQRGEMSVHRAGSYFGVPHSTLEYKVKERHLMRPRKREPKPQPGLDGSSTSSSTAKSNSNIPGHNSLDKLKLGAGASANSKLNKSNNNNSAAAAAAAAAFPNAASNGMKLPMFDSAVPLPYTQHLFWQHSQAAAFGQLQMDFNRSASAQGGAAAELLKSHTQRYQEEALRSAGSGGAVAGPPSASTPSPIASPLSAQSAHHALGMKGARELAENIYESGGANGSSILDGIIRKTLDRKSGDVVPASGVGGALRDQLLAKKTTLPYTNYRSNEHASSSASAGAGVKRAGSPLPYTEIKRERTSPAHSSDEDASHSGAEDAEYEHNNNNNNNNNSSKSNLSGNGGLLGADHHHHHHHHQQRSRLTSRDSETDASSNRSEMLHTHHNHSNSCKMADLNGGGGGALAKLEPPAELGATSILQEKLAQIKAEQESEENL